MIQPDSAAQWTRHKSPDTAVPGLSLRPSLRNVELLTVDNALNGRVQLPMVTTPETGVRVTALLNVPVLPDAAA